SAPPRAPHLVRRHIPGGKRRFDSLGTNVQGFDMESPWSLDGVPVAVLGFDNDLQGLVTRAVIIIQAARAATQGDLLQAIGLRCLLGSEPGTALPDSRGLAQESLVFALLAIKLLLGFTKVLFTRAQFGFEQIPRTVAV